MATNDNNLPQPEDIQWQPLCVSEDMTDRVKERNLQSIRELDDKVKRGYGAEATIGEALNDTLTTFIVKTNLEYTDAVKQREILISQVKEVR